MEKQHAEEIVAMQKNHVTEIVAMQDSLDALSENLLNESEALFWTDKLLKTTEQIAGDNLNLAVEKHNQLLDVSFMAQLNENIQQSVSLTQSRLAENRIRQCQSDLMEAIETQGRLDKELAQATDNYLFETSVLRSDLNSAKDTIGTLNDQMSKLLRRESELAEQLSLTRKVLSMVPRN